MRRFRSNAERQQGGLVLLTLGGEIDLANASQLRSDLFEQLPNTVRGAVLDLSGVSYFDSAAVRLVFELAETLRRHGQRLRLVVPRGSLAREVIEHVALDAVVPVDEDREVSLESLRTEVER